jgi:hypothetical protein
LPPVAAVDGGCDAGVAFTWTPGASRDWPPTTTVSLAASPCVTTVILIADLDVHLGDGLVRFDNIGEQPVGTVLHRQRGNGDRLRQHVDLDARIHELAGPEMVVVVGKRRLQRDRAGGGVDRVVRCHQRAGGEHLRGVLAVGCLDRHGTFRSRGLHLTQFVLRQGEHHGNRLVLGDRDDARRGLGGDLDQIADIHLVQADPSVDRRAQHTVVQIELRGLDRRIVERDRGDVLVDRRLLVVHLLDRCELALRKILITLQVELRALQQCRVLGPLRDRLVERRFVRRRIDLGDDVALFDFLPLVHRHGDQLTIHLCLDLVHVIGLHRAKAVEKDRHVLNLRRRGGDRHLRRRGGIGGTRRAGIMHDAPSGEHAGNHNQSDYRQAPRCHDQDLHSRY